ncbi:hypothetical protein [Chondromyces crocatus]|uniref:Uncharacterized protein n=1 Tax=Chondromyces crocatus TaxID=52 RepID=A0A0K1E5I3_CHOCO|nr:hypothetical protein [Chondromyces crocatus]AKT36094.1 uncharacterized protein CMC5_002070 [Chondromyces crocatus]
MSTQIEDLSCALTDVRRAYRLLQVYHRRLCDLLHAIDETLRAEGMEFSRWEPKNVARLPKATKPFFGPDRWAWELTPAYQVECIWDLATKGRARRVIVEAIGDSGYNPVDDGEPDPARFMDESQAATELHLGLWSAPTKRIDWDAARAVLERMQGWDQEGAQTLVVGGVDVRFQRLRVDLAQLVDVQAEHEKITGPLESWLRQG